MQMLSTRGRKDVDAKDVKVKVIVEAFDILYLNGKVGFIPSATIAELPSSFRVVGGEKVCLSCHNVARGDVRWSVVTLYLLYSVRYKRTLNLTRKVGQLG